MNNFGINKIIFCFAEVLKNYYKIKNLQDNLDTLDFAINIRGLCLLLFIAITCQKFQN
jgi:hypothetical protein